MIHSVSSAFVANRNSAWEPAKNFAPERKVDHPVESGRLNTPSGNTLERMARSLELRNFFSPGEKSFTKGGVGGAGAVLLDGKISKNELDVNGYRIGSPQRPDIRWDDDFKYDPEAKPTAGDHASWVKWEGMLRGAQTFRPDLDDALALYEHYRGNTGKPVTFDYEEAVREDQNVAANVEHEIALTVDAVDQMAATRGDGTFQVTGPAHPAPEYPNTENWQKAIGGYQQWSSANVTVANGMVTMEITVHAEDKYNFNAGAQDIATGTPDAENGRFAELGWAQGFETSGVVTRTITWPVGSPPPEIDLSQGGGLVVENRGPGGEDRSAR